MTLLKKFNLKIEIEKLNYEKMIFHLKGDDIFQLIHGPSSQPSKHTRAPVHPTARMIVAESPLFFSLLPIKHTLHSLSNLTLCLLLISTLSVRRHCSFACLCSTSPFKNNNAIRGTLMLSSLSSFNHLYLSALPSQLEEPSALFALFPLSTKNRYFHLPR